MSPHDFQRLIAGVTEQLAGRPLDGTLTTWLNDTYPANGATFRELADACRTGVVEGWLCNREGGGIRYGRIFKALPETHGFSVDVVDMKDIAGPHHVHPNGEIDLIMPLTEGRHLRRSSGRLVRVRSRQRASADRCEWAGAGAVSAAARRDRIQAHRSVAARDKHHAIRQ